MTTTDLGACEWFVWDLRRSNLMDRGQLDQVVGEFLRKEPRAEPKALAQYLVEQEILTDFQAQRLLHGKTQGLVLGPYSLTDALGTGSMGTVYKAQSKNDNQWYAVKVLPRRSMWNVRIARRQVRAFEQLSHPAVVPFVDVGTAGSTHYLSWPLVEGETLEVMVKEQGKLAPDLAALYILQATEGLEACHQKEIIHGLLKPSNIMVGSDGQVRILDFGIGILLASAEGESLVDTMSTANSVTSGLDCASPECIMEPSNRTARGDQYSLGCVLYFCLAGQYPFPDGTAVEKMLAHQTKEPTPVRELNPDVPEKLADVVTRLMHKTPEGRFDNMSAVAEALRPLAAVPSVLVRRMVHRPPGMAPAKANGRQGPTGAVEVPLVTSETPLPPTRGSAPALPTRQSLRPEVGGQSTPAAATVTEKPRRVATTLVLDPPRLRWSLEEQLGPVGLIAGAALAAALTWLVSLWFF
jgi:serine/threonine-protein kinase